MGLNCRTWILGRECMYGWIGGGGGERIRLGSVLWMWKTDASHLVTNIFKRKQKVIKIGCLRCTTAGFNPWFPHRRSQRPNKEPPRPNKCTHKLLETEYKNAKSFLPMKGIRRGNDQTPNRWVQLTKLVLKEIAISESRDRYLHLFCNGRQQRNCSGCLVKTLPVPLQNLAHSDWWGFVAPPRHLSFYHFSHCSRRPLDQTLIRLMAVFRRVFFFQSLIIL